jgi:NADPH:quinone reductase
MLMRAVGITAFGGPDVMEIVQVPVPEMKPAQIRLRVHAAAVNPTDIERRRTGIGWALTGDPPWVSGMDAAGVIDEIGRDAARLRPELQVGDRVMAIVVPFGRRMGAQADQVVVPAESVITIPDGMSFEEAATIPMNALTAHLCVAALRASPGGVIAVTGGAGMLASYVIAIACDTGLRVVADAADTDHGLVQSYGAQLVLPRGDGLGLRIRAAIPEGVDGVIDTAVIGPDLLAAVRDGGTVVAVRAWAGQTERAITIEEVMVGYSAKDRVAVEAVEKLLTRNVIVPRVAAVFAPEEIGLAHRLMEAGGVRGRPVVRFA